MRKFILLLVLLLTISSYAQVFKTVNLTTAGTLSTFFNDYEKTTITNLTLTGNIDASDFQFMHVISSLVDLNISGTTIMAYTGIYGSDQRHPQSIVSYPANEIPCWAGYFQTITLPKNLKSIGDEAFYSDQIKTISIPNTVISIGNEAFYHSGLTGVLTIPSSVKTIGSYAFNGCSGLTSITIPSSVTSIGSGAFDSCSGLTGTLTIPSSVTSIGSDAFSYCFGLTSVIFENSNPLTYYTTIGDAVFYGCENLKILYLSNSIISIGDLAFYQCPSLQIIYSFNPNPPTLESNTFSTESIFSTGRVTDVFVISDDAINNYKTWYVVSWFTFFPGNIIKIIPLTDTPRIQNYNINVYSIQSSIVIEGISVGETVKIYLSNGVCLQTLKSQGERLVIQENKKAIYLVKISNKIFKIII